MHEAEPLTTYLELRESDELGGERAGLSHSGEGLVLLHVLELAAHGEPRGGVTLVHDAGDHGGRYVALARSLAQRRWAVALPDLRGHGKSEGARGHCAGVSEVVRDVEAIQDHLAYRLPDAPKVLLGVGLGAVWSLAFAAEKSDALVGLVLVAPRWKPSFDLPKPPTGLFKAFKKLAPDAPGKIGNEASRLSSDEAERSAWRADALVHDVITLRAGEEARAAAALAAGRVAALALPVLILAGSDDAYGDAAQCRALARNGVEVEVIQGGAHDLFHDRVAAQATERLAGWLERQA